MKTNHAVSFLLKTKDSFQDDLSNLASELHLIQAKVWDYNGSKIKIYNSIYFIIINYIYQTFDNYFLFFYFTILLYNFIYFTFIYCFSNFVSDVTGADEQENIG